MSNNKSSVDGVRRSSPIPIAHGGGFRGRSASVSSGSSSSASPPSDLPTPPSGPISPRITIPSPGSSPILSYFLSQSPSKSAGGTAATFPFRKFGTAPVFEEGESPPQTEPHVVHHARRASVNVADRFSQPSNTALPETQAERGAGFLRRLSLSTSGPAFSKPSCGQPSPPEVPPNSAVNPSAKGRPFPRDAKHRRATTSERPRRAPSPMGERILKGHFDGFN